MIVQRFGDYCQSIFEGEENDGVENEELKDDQVLYIRNSNRFGENSCRYGHYVWKIIVNL